ncbi:fungal-specific transcription factor domain-containing protein [Phaeosphaeriaceae sp. PMI808]|nr:fungal-specific transcription factor domain-containing protein [Phaeosphaeriaceae sp. PMI808]
MNRSANASSRELPAGREATARPAKRNRITVACASCRQRKSRCDGSRPKCSTCAHQGTSCEYSSSEKLTKLSASKELVGGLETRVATLENVFAGLSSRMSRVESLNNGDITSEPTINHGTHHPSFTHDPTLPGLDPSMEIQDPTDGIGSLAFTEEEGSVYFGPTSNIAFTRQIVRATTKILKRITSTSSPITPSDTEIRSHIHHISRPSSPPPEFPRHSGNILIGAEPFVLPPEEETMQLINLYFSSSNVLFPFIDQPGFLTTYRQVTRTSILSVRRSWLGLLNMMLAMATSANVRHGSPITAQERAARSDAFYRRAMVLCDRQIRHVSSLEVVQLLLLASQYLQGTERSVDTWNIHGLAVKAAYQLGLHSPDALQRYPPIEREIRKRIWFGCVLLDRTLGMTMGRPLFIPDHFIKVELPQPIQDTELQGDSSQSHEFASVSFFRATITLYAIMSEVFDMLYGNNIGCGVPTDVFEMASILLQFEQKFFAWQRALPKCISLITGHDLVSGLDEFQVMRLRVILTLRFLNLRILTHRPLLCKYLEIIGSSEVDEHQLMILRQVGVNSIQTCVQSALLIIKMTRWALEFREDSQHLLGAWWFSLYYAFNASLVIYSTLLLKHQSEHYSQGLALEESELSFESLQKAIDCLSILFVGNRMTENCVRYTSALAYRLALLYQSDQSHGTTSVENPQDVFTRYLAPRDSLDAASRQNIDYFDSTDLYLGIELDDLFRPLAAEFTADD